ncbi:MAG: hypothetical protein J07HR59_00045 [Halorubrum sp. J07HR59]|nr:MAG: hypothetical protein J07HR59_00045 [Halorubrum sp. J07HR59]
MVLVGTNCPRKSVLAENVELHELSRGTILPTETHSQSAAPAEERFNSALDTADLR